ncbi:MAG: hypothetical protein GC154_02705 [bacterium]|nr:hypothetical protein [bacterium]
MNQKFVICIKNDDYPASLEKLKLYESLPDKAAENDGFIRVIDESGEDYLFPVDYFIPVDLPHSTEKVLVDAAESSRLNG